MSQSWWPGQSLVSQSWWPDQSLVAGADAGVAKLVATSHTGVGDLVDTLDSGIGGNGAVLVGVATAAGLLEVLALDVAVFIADLQALRSPTLFWDLYGNCISHFAWPTQPGQWPIVCRARSSSDNFMTFLIPNLVR